MNKLKCKPVQKIGVMLLFSIVVILLFLLPGLTEQNIDFFLPRRMIKISAILITAYCIGYSSVVFQTITNNNILTPSVMGLDSLYLFVQTVIVFFFGSGSLMLMTGTTNFLLSIGVMIGFSLLLFLLLFSRGSRNIYFMILAGIICGSLFQGIATFMQVLLDPNEFLIMQGKMFASFSRVNEELLILSAAITLVMMIIVSRDNKTLDVMALGPEQAINLGVPYRRMLLKMLIVSVILISVSTALTGPVTFLGILTASLSRQIMRVHQHKFRIWGAVLIAVLSLAGGQMILERIFTFNTTISVVINFIGGIYFICLLLREGKQV